MVKIQVAFEHGLHHKWTVENIWATLVNAQDQYYRLENIPVYAPFVAYHDVVRCVWDGKQEAPVYKELIQPSGHSTIQVFRMKEEGDMVSFAEKFTALNCRVDLVDESYCVVDVPDSVAYGHVKNVLESLRAQNIIEYAESCLSPKHYY